MSEAAPDRLSVDQACSPTWDLDADLDFYAARSIHTIGVQQSVLEATGDALVAAERIVAAGLRVSTLWAPNPLRLDDPEQWLDGAYALGKSLDLATALGTDSLTITTGASGELTWERAADALDEALTPTLREAEREHLVVLLRLSEPPRGDDGFVHTLRDLLELSWRLGTGICLDPAACWYERNLAGSIAVATERIGLVRVRPDDIPWARIVGQLEDAGYEGLYEVGAARSTDDEADHAAAIDRGLRLARDLLQADEDAEAGGVDPDA